VVLEAAVEERVTQGQVGHQTPIKVRLVVMAEAQRYKVRHRAIPLVAEVVWAVAQPHLRVDLAVAVVLNQEEAAGHGGSSFPQRQILAAVLFTAQVEAEVGEASRRIVAQVGLGARIRQAVEAQVLGRVPLEMRELLVSLGAEMAVAAVALGMVDKMLVLAARVDSLVGVAVEAVEMKHLAEPQARGVQAVMAR
jgi:hypothetical protein